MARVAVVFTGGTISTVFDPVAGGNVPVLDGAAILARTPGLDSIAEVVAIDRGRIAASHFTFPQLLDIAAVVREVLADPGVDGAVVVQGTDTIEETSFCWDLVLAGDKPVVVTGAMRASDEAGFDGPANLRDAIRIAASPQARGLGVVVSLGGTIEPADDVTKLHSTALDTFASPNGGSLGRVEASGISLLRARGGRRHVTTDRAAERVHLITATVAMDARLLDAALAAGADGIVVAATGSGQHLGGAPGSGRAGDAGRGPGGPRVTLRLAAARRPVTPFRAVARPGSRAGALPVGHLCALKARVALALGLGAGLDRDGLIGLLADPVPGTAEPMPLDALITGRIATLAGEAGFGWVEAIGIRDGRVAFAGSEVALETRADPFTERFVLEPDEVAIPGLTDAHLHLAQTAAASRQVDLSDAATLAEGLARIGAAHERLADPDAWLEGHGWDSDRWGRWPTAGDLEPVAPGRRCAIWAHDHHALLASRAALLTGGVDRDTPDPMGGVIGRDSAGDPDGVLYEAAARLVAIRVPSMATEDLEAAVLAVGRGLLALGIVAVHDPGRLAPDPDLSWSFPALRRLADSGRLPVRVHASIRSDGLAFAAAHGLRSGDLLGEDPASRARVGWLKLFADGSLGSRTAALLEDIETEPDRPLPPERRRGVWITEPAELAELVERAADVEIASQIHAIGDAAVRAALGVLASTATHLPLMPRLEHVQLLDPADRSSFAAAGIAASVQPVHLGTDAAQARMLWGARAERSGYTWGSIARTGAVLAFGTDAPVESFDPWPGIALAVRREDPRWPAGTPAFGPEEALSLDRALRAACVDPAVIRPRDGSGTVDGRPASGRGRHPGRRAA